VFGAPTDLIERRLYVHYVIANKLTREEIQAGLQSVAPTGVIAPTIHGLCVYLNLLGTRDTNGDWLPDDELAFLIWRNLSKQYVA
jgi:hypothetical protein